MYLDFDHRNFLGEDRDIISPSEKRRLQTQRFSHHQKV